MWYQQQTNEEEHRAFLEWSQQTLKADKSYHSWLDHLNQIGNGGNPTNPLTNQQEQKT